MNEMLETKKTDHAKFQILFLRNGRDQAVEVHEVKQVDFLTVQEHLEQGESVFITSRNSQKVAASKPKLKAPRSMKTKLVTAFSFDNL